MRALRVFRAKYSLTVIHSSWLHNLRLVMKNSPLLSVFAIGAEGGSWITQEVIRYGRGIFEER